MVPVLTAYARAWLVISLGVDFFFSESKLGRCHLPGPAKNNTGHFTLSKT
jgi:hypothetical protein